MKVRHQRSVRCRLHRRPRLLFRRQFRWRGQCAAPCGRAGMSRRKRVGRKCREFHPDQNPYGVANVVLARPVTTPAIQAFSSAAGSQCADVYQSDGQCGLSKPGIMLLAPCLFEFGDVCPCGGYLPGCPGEPQAGIEPENVERICRPFFATKKDIGRGLGLRVPQEIIQNH